MPLPLLFIGIGAATGALGIGKGIKAGIDMKDAKDTNQYANNIVENAKNSLEKARKNSGKSLENLGSKKLYILDKSINSFIKAFEQLRNVELSESVGLNELNKFKIDKQSLTELKELGGYATSILGGAATGALGGALSAFGAWGAATTFATASTGTAIASLSGAAATNATLAFFGGGSLAAGGLGMAGGTAVLGGLVAGPALAVMGFVIGAKASAQKDKAYANLATAKETAEELKIAEDLCHGIRRRANMFYNYLIRMDTIFSPLIFELEQIIETSGTDYSSFDETQKKTVAAACSWASAIKALLDTPILSEEGNLTEESEKLSVELAQLDSDENSSKSQENTYEENSVSEDDEMVYPWKSIDLEKLDYNDLSGYTFDELNLIEGYIDSYDDPDYRKSCRVLVRNEIAIRYLEGVGIEKDDKKAFEYYMKSASSGDPHAQFKLGQCYEYGWGTEEKTETAFKWYKKSSEQGYAEAQNALGDCYWYGTGIEKDEVLAREWYEQAASQGNTGAEYMLKTYFN